MDNQETRKLCQAARNGDRNAASRLLAHFYEPVFRYLRRLCGSDADAADLTQLVFRKVWASLPGYREASSFSTWVHSIAYRTHLDGLRKPDRTTSPGDYWWESLPSGTPSPFENTAQSEEATRVYRAVETLEDDARQAVHLHYYQELSLRETAEVLGIPTSTLKYRLRGALEHIRRSVDTISQPISKGGNHD